MQGKCEICYLKGGVFSSAVSGGKNKNIHHIIKILDCDQTVRFIQLIMYSVPEGMFTS